MVDESERLAEGIIPSRDTVRSKEKNKLLNEIEKIYGKENIILDLTKTLWGHRNFHKFNCIGIKNQDVDNYVLLGYSAEHLDKWFFGFDISFTDNLVSHIIENPLKQVYAFFLFMLEVDKTVQYFPVPIFFIKNNEGGISTSDNHGKSKPQYKINIQKIKGKICLRLAGGEFKDISEFQVNLDNLFNPRLSLLHDEERRKYEGKIVDKAALIKQFYQ